MYDKKIMQHKFKEFSTNLLKDFEDRFSRVFSAHAGCCTSLKEKNEANGCFGQKEYTNLLVIMNFHSSWLHILQQELIVS